MAPPYEAVLDILLFLHRFDAEQSRLVCRRWSQVVVANEALWHDKIRFEDVSRATFPVSRVLFSETEKVQAQL